MRIVFMGTPSFSASILSALIASDHDVVGVVTRPDAVRGRGKKLVASDVKQLALEHGVPVLECASFKHDEAFEALRAMLPDVVCVAAFGAILPKRVLDLPKYGCINVHASLLPRWRGAAPVERAILSGDKQTGIGIMRMEEGLDTGPTAQMRSVAISSQSAEELTAELAVVGGEALVEVLDTLDAGNTVTWTPQSEEGVTYAEKITKGELNLDPALSTSDALRRVQASSDSHPSRSMVADKGVTVIASCAAPDISLQRGSVAFVAKKLYLGLCDGAMEVLQVKPDGKKPMDAKAFAAGIQGIKQGNVEWQGVNGN